jgi:hypothetical protein
MPPVALVHPHMAETTEVTLAIEVISEVVVGVVEDEVGGAMIAAIEVEKQSVITEDQETIEDLRHFATTEAGIAIAGIVMIASEVVDHHLLKVEPVHPIMHLAKIEMGHQT